MNDDNHKYCTHVSCRLDTLTDLTVIARAKGSPMSDHDIVEKFIELRSKEVRCKIRPRAGGVLAPFPGETS